MLYENLAQVMEEKPPLVEVMEGNYDNIFQNVTLTGKEKKFEILEHKGVTRVKFDPYVISLMKDVLERERVSPKRVPATVEFTGDEIVVKADFPMGSAIVQYFLSTAMTEFWQADIKKQHRRLRQKSSELQKFIQELLQKFL